MCAAKHGASGVYHGIVFAFRHDKKHPGVPEHLVHPLGRYLIQRITSAISTTLFLPHYSRRSPHPCLRVLLCDFFIAFFNTLCGDSALRPSPQSFIRL